MNFWIFHDNRVLILITLVELIARDEIKFVFFFLRKIFVYTLNVNLTIIRIKLSD